MARSRSATGTVTTSSFQSILVLLSLVSSDFGSLPTAPSGPAGARRGCPGDDQLSGPGRLVHVLHTAPFGGEHEQRTPIRAAEHAGEGGAVEVDRLQHLPALADPHTAPVRHVGVPDRALG